VTRSLIEQWFPAAAVGAESLRERGTPRALPWVFGVHVWWARRPLSVSRAAVVASLLPAWPDETEVRDDPPAQSVLEGLRKEFPRGEDEYRAWFVRSLGILGDPALARAQIQAAVARGETTDGNAYGYERAFTSSPDNETVDRIVRLAGLRAEVDPAPILLDPFAGGGSIPFEAARFGCSSVAGELNPVAAAVLNATVDLPAVLGPDFAHQIKTWGRRWCERVGERLRPFFPNVEADERLAYIWAHTVPCPTTGHPTPLAPDLWLARGKAGRDVAVRLDADRETGAIAREVVEGEEARAYGPRSTYKRGTGVSVFSGETFGADYIRQRALAGEMGETLLAISVTRRGVSGRRFRAPSAADLEAVAAAEVELERSRTEWEIEDLIPSEPRHIGPADRSANYGLLNARDLFTPRQLLTNVTALEELRCLETEARAELPEHEARAVTLYLALALDKSVDYNGMLSSWDATRLKVRNTFDRHDFSFKLTFAELDGANTLLPWAVDNGVDAYRGIARLANRPQTLIEKSSTAQAQIILGSATSLPLADRSVDAVVTDPPYYDNVMYGECSDYFYVWLKRALRESWPELCVQTLSDKQEEAVANPSLFRDVATHSGRGKRTAGTRTAAELADGHYERMLTRSFREAHRVLKDDGVLTVMFTHKRVDAWDTLGAALLEAGFSISSSWPVHTESEHSLHQAKKNAASSTILLTCRKRAATEPGYWEDLRRPIAEAAREAARRFSAQGITGVDLSIASYGPALAVLSRNWPVYTGELDEQGEPELLRPDRALDLAREEVSVLKKRGLLGGRQVDFDRVSDYYLLAWSDFKAAEFPSGEALKLSIATHLDLDDLKREHRLLSTSGGWVTLLTPAQRRTAGAIDPDDGAFATRIDALHALMLVFDEEGLAAARSWLERDGRADDPSFRALFEAALNAIPRTREKGELTRPEARTLERLRATIFDDVAAPPEPDAELAAGRPDALPGFEE
jgi:adenine-specific DNA methylase